MGEDIHHKVYLYSKVEKKYIDALQLKEHTTVGFEYMFPTIWEGRNYDIFSIIAGSGRSSYDILPSANFGFPDFFEGTTINEYLKRFKGSYYGYVWYYITDMHRDILKYMLRLYDPLVYYENEQYEFDSFKSNEEDRRYWVEETMPIIHLLNEIDMSLEKYFRLKVDDDSGYFGGKNVNDLIDIDKTIVLFWLDN